jgi:hypothetical protein
MESRLEIRGVAHARADIGAGGDALPRLQTQGAQLRREAFQGAAVESAEGHGSGDVHQAGFPGQGRLGLGKKRA